MPHARFDVARARGVLVALIADGRFEGLDECRKRCIVTARKRRRHRAAARMPQHDDKSRAQIADCVDNAGKLGRPHGVARHAHGE